MGRVAADGSYPKFPDNCIFIRFLVMSAAFPPDEPLSIA
jgi:hypothetical protein